MNTEVTDDWIISKENNDLADSFEDIDVNAKGFDLTRSPRHRFTLWFNYAWPLGDAGMVDFMSLYAYTDEQYHDVLNIPINQAPSFERWDARVSWHSPTKKYRVAAFVNNITNELGIEDQNTGPIFGRHASTSAPRSWGVQLQMQFGAQPNQL